MKILPNKFVEIIFFVIEFLGKLISETNFWNKVAMRFQHFSAESSITGSMELRMFCETFAYINVICKGSGSNDEDDEEGRQFII